MSVNWFTGDLNYTAPAAGYVTGADLGGVRWVWTNPPFRWFIRLTGSLLLPAVFNTQRWRSSPVLLQYNLRTIQFNVHAVK